MIKEHPKMYKQQIHDYIWSHRDEMIAQLSKLVAFPSVQQNVRMNIPLVKNVPKCWIM